MTTRIDEINDQIEEWQRRLNNWLAWDYRNGGSDGALRGAQACLDEIAALRRERGFVLTNRGGVDADRR